MFSINKNNTQVGILLGTMHISKIQILDIKEIKTEIDKCTSIYVESTLEDAKKLIDEHSDVLDDNLKNIKISKELGSMDLDLVNYFKENKFEHGSLEEHTKEFVQKTINPLFESLNNITINPSIILYLEHLWMNHLWNIEDPYSKFRTSDIFKDMMGKRDEQFKDKIIEILSNTVNKPLFAVGAMHINPLVDLLTKDGYQLEQIMVNSLNNIQID